LKGAFDAPENLELDPSEEENYERQLKEVRDR
jgi:hypothetical protein